jgi:hypothetical protein
MVAKETEISEVFEAVRSSVINQYSVKVIQGIIKDPYGDNPPESISPGIFFSSVNVHNPWRHAIRYAVKMAISGPYGKTGKISVFQYYELPPDGATQFGFEDFKTLLGGLPSFTEGYFVIESQEELDVVGVYTGAAIQDQRLGAIHMERVPARKVSRCRDVKIDVSTGIAAWKLTVTADSANVPQGIAAPAAKNSAWATEPNSGVKWVGNKNYVNKGDYTYEFSFHLDETFLNPQLNFTLWVDDTAKIYINGVQKAVASGFTGAGTPIVITSGFQVGTNTIKVLVNNAMVAMGMMVFGKFSAEAADCSGL